MNLGNIIYQLRKNSGLNQQEFAKKVGITQTYLSQLESNKKDGHVNTLKAICDFVEIPYPVLILLAMDESDVTEEKKEAYQLMFPSVKMLIGQLFPAVKQIELSSGA
jgi:XRE family transcriptional regulator, regulator of sulfur utilization